MEIAANDACSANAGASVPDEVQNRNFLGRRPFGHSVQAHKSQLTSAAQSSGHQKNTSRHEVLVNGRREAAGNISAHDDAPPSPPLPRIRRRKSRPMLSEKSSLRSPGHLGVHRFLEENHATSIDQGRDNSPSVLGTCPCRLGRANTMQRIRIPRRHLQQELRPCSGSRGCRDWFRRGRNLGVRKRTRRIAYSDVVSASQGGTWQTLIFHGPLHPS